MNRRIPVKKNYFSFLPDLSGSRIVHIGLFMMAVMVVILPGWFILGSIEIDASAVFGVFALFAIPVVILLAVFSGFEKLTGIRCLRGVEWIGEKTLQFFDLIILNIQKLRGIDLETGNHRAVKSDAVLSRSNHSTDRVAGIEASKTNTVEPVLDFAAIDMADPLLGPLASKPQVFAESPIDDPEQNTNVAVELPREEKTSVTQADPSETILNVPIDEQPFVDDVDVDVDISVFESDDPDLDFAAIDVQNPLLEPLVPKPQIFTEAPASEIDSTLSSALERPTIEENVVRNTAPLNAVLSDQIEDQSVIDSGAVARVGTYHEGSKDDRLSAIVPELEIDEVEREIISLFQEEQYAMADDSVADPENKLAMEEGGFVEATSSDQEESEDGSDLSINSLLEEMENKVIDLENEGNDFSKATEVTEGDINQLINTIELGDNAISNTDNPPLHSSMLFQAEQTAANILSSFSERFSRSSEKISQSFGFQNKPEYHLPSIDLLHTHQRSVRSYSPVKLEEMSRSVERVLKDYKVLAEVMGAYPGPIITRFELLLAPGVKVSRVSGLAKDLARAMLVTSVRVVEIIEGTPYIGLEIPNQERELVSFRDIIASENYQQAASPLTFALGKDVSGQTVVSDLAKMPHLLVAGTTGSGKSVAINTMILSMLYKATPEQVRMIMIDPKMLELSIYEGIPHLLTPVVTDMKEAHNSLRWAVAEMERRYKLMSKVGVRNLAGFNQKIEEAAARGETVRDPLFQLIDPLEEGEIFPVLSTLPSIVIVIDELADMMMIVGKKVEELIARLAQKARAAGIHLVLATQRPSVDVLTGLIKANVPTRISFQVSSRIDSRTILDQGGAESLLGNGDMLFLPSGTSVPTRSHGAFVGDDEVHAVVDYLKTQGGPNYLTEIVQEAPTENTTNSEAVQDETDELYDDAVSFVMETGRASISSVQRRFKVGYNRAARMIDQMEEENIVSEPEGNGSRRVLNREE